MSAVVRGINNGMQKQRVRYLFANKERRRAGAAGLLPILSWGKES